MKMQRNSLAASRVVFACAASLAFGWAGSVLAGNLSISNVPLGTGTGISVKPNLVFILDDSGSMGSDYMPDYINDSDICPNKDNWGGATDSCTIGDPPYTTAALNTVYYNPAIRYRPPKKADGTEFDNADPSTPYSNFYPLNASGTPASTSTKTLASYQNTAWCKTNSDTPNGNPATDTNCAYYPVGTAFDYYPKYPDATYKYRRTYNGPPVYYTMSGKPTWCSDTALTTCQAKRSNTFKYPKFSAQAEVAGVQASRTFLIKSTSAGGQIATICFGDDNNANNGCSGVNLLTSPITIGNGNRKARRQELADALASAVLPAGWSIVKLRDDLGGSNDNPCSDSNCPQLKIIAPGNATSTSNASYNTKYLNLPEPTGFDFSNQAGQLTGGIDYLASSGAVSFTRYHIVSGSTYPKAAGRDDCSGSTCSYTEELQNFANWYQFYRYRMSMTKTAISRAFSGISDTAPGAGFRIGLMTLSGGSNAADACVATNKNLEVDVGDFVQTQKNTFYSNLFQIEDCSYTPLRGALSRAGRYYAGQTVTNGGTTFTDPVQFSCQQNFAFLSTDGYWNNNIESSSFGPLKTDGSTLVGNQDGTSSTNKDGSAVIAPQLDKLNVSNTLADVAFYYYNTDLRSSMIDDVPKSSRDQASYQHMVTFTMGLGVDGLLGYDKDYEYGASADYVKVQQGLLDWPNTSSDEAKIDDLWHAAVNGRGKYFSARSPDEVAASLNEALVGVSAIAGSGAAAATSNLEPVAGDNYAYVASYVTQTWEGNIEARTIDLTTGVLASTASWSAQAILDGQAAAATTPTGASGPGNRKLFTYDSSLTGTDKKMLLTWANAQAKGWDTGSSDYFNPTQLGQCPNITTDCPGATRANLFSYLMGGTDTTDNGSYRGRAHVLGDIVSSQPVFVRKPPFAYSDSNYDTFKNTSTRKGMVYVGANDGFLHAFDADTGVEDWAYAPKALIPELYQLAASNYTHRYYVDGSITAGDVLVGTAWKSIVVGGLNSGGKIFYALDVTDPTTPLALWEFTDGRMGYTFGNPVITKLPTGSTSSGGADIAGKWVVLLTSGYNNGGTSFASHNGIGVLYVLDAYTGEEYFRLYTCTNQSDDTTCAGTSAAPNGLAKINSWAEDPSRNNTSLYAYGGDLEGNLWRFDLANKSAFKIANVAEPITVKPELAEVSGKRVVFFGTGLFLQATDKSDATRRSIYAIKDDPSATSALVDVKTSGDLVEQTMTVLATDTSLRTISSPVNPVNWANDYGWFVTLLEDRERVNVDPKIQLGTLVIASNVPDAGAASSCTTGGHAWINYLDIATGGYVINNQSNPNAVSGKRIANALAVGVNVVKLPNGKLITIVTTSDNQHPVTETPVGSANLPVKRISWRELVTD